MTTKAWFDCQFNAQSREEPGLSLLSVVIIVLIALSALLFALETEPALVADWGGWLFAVNIGILLVFAVEFFLRIWSAGETRGIAGLGDRLRYAEPGWLAVDFLAFAPELTLLVVLYAIGDYSAEWIISFKLVRLLRLGKLLRYMPGVRILVETIASVGAELVASVSIAAALIFLSAVLIHFAEGTADPENFGSVPRALWWSVVTLTTVGYGDVLPHTILGRVAAGAVAILGVGVVALPSGIVAGAFIERLRAERMKKRKADEETSE